MSAFKRIATIAMTTAGVLAMPTTISTPAQARDGFNGALVGGLAAGALRLSFWLLDSFAAF